MKNEIDSSRYYKDNSISTIHALLNDFSNNKANYLKIFNDNNNTQSVSHQFLEDLYRKYSRSLEKYMMQNKRGMLLQGNKKYDNLPIDIFIKESKGFKEAILNKLHDKDKANSVTLPIKFICLTPLPDKPRVLLTTQQEKDEFQQAERVAVVMRTVEYTNVLKNQANQYASMEKEERLQMIYMMKKASSIIQNWWFTKGKEGTKRRRKTNAVKNKGTALRVFQKVLSNIEDCFDNHKNVAWRDIKCNYIQSKYKIDSNEFTLTNVVKTKNKRLLYHWGYYTKGVSVKYFNANYVNDCSNTSNSVVNRNNKLTLIPMLQKKIKAFLSKQSKKHIKLDKLYTLIKRKSMENDNRQMKAFIHWFHIINYYNSIYYRKMMSNDGNNNNGLLSTQSSLPIWTSYLSYVLNDISNKRYKDVLLALKLNQKKKKGITNADINPAKKKVNAKAISIIQNIITNIIRNKKNSLWKAFQIWNILNTIIHTFVSKMTRGLIQNNQLKFFTQLKGTTGDKYSNNQNRNNKANQRYFIDSNANNENKVEVALRFYNNRLDESI